MANYRNWRSRGRSKVVVIKQRARRYYAKKKKINPAYLVAGAAVVGAFVFKDKIKTLLNK